MDASAQDLAGDTPLHAVCKVGAADSVEFLLSRGVHVDPRNRCGETPLFLGCMHDDTGIIRRLLDARARVDLQNKYGFRPFMRACERGHIGVAQLLAEAKAGVFVADKQGDTVLHISSVNRCSAILRWLLSLEGACGHAGALHRRSSFQGMTALHMSVSANVPETTALLIQARSCVNTATQSGESTGATNGVTALHLSILMKSPETIKLLLGARACVNKATKIGGTTLHWSVVNNSPVAAALLLQARACVNKTDKRGWSALHCAADRKDVPLIDMLARARADVNSHPRVHPRVPLQCLPRTARRADVSLHLRPRGSTPLMVAARSGDLPTVRFLVDLGARVPGPRGLFGQTAEGAAKTQAVKRFLGQCAIRTGQPAAKRRR